MTISLVNGTLIDGTSSNPVENSVLNIQGKRIIESGPRDSVRIPQGSRIIDCSNMTLMPGLIDAHTHLSTVGEQNRYTAFGNTRMSQLGWSIQSVANAARTLQAGITTVRDVGALPYITIELRDAIERGVVEGPRILTCNQGIGITGGHADNFKHSTFEGFRNPPMMMRVADGVDEVRRAVREQIKVGADWIKFFASGGVLESEEGRINALEYSHEEIRAIVEEAARGQRKCAVHCQPAEQIKACIELGVKTVEHGVFATREVIELMKQKQVSYVFTLTVYDHYATHESNMPDATIDAAKRATKAQQECFRIATELGVNIGMGTDAGAPMITHGSNAKELELFVKFGMSPLQAIQASTMGSARAIGIEGKTGSLEEGKFADVLVVEGDVLKDIKILQDKSKIRHIFKEGRPVSQSPTVLSNA